MSNLVPNPERSPEELRENGKKGGLKSGESRRERKQLKKELEILLSTGDTQEKMCLALIKRALNGDVRAFVEIRDTLGEKPLDRVEVANTPTSEAVREIEEYVRSKINES